MPELEPASHSASSEYRTCWPLFLGGLSITLVNSYVFFWAAQSYEGETTVASAVGVGIGSIATRIGHNTP